MHYRREGLRAPGESELPIYQTTRMLTLHQTLTDQQDLDRLCSDRPHRTEEVFAPNAFYGNARVLKQYARLPSSYSLKAVLPHGVVLNANDVWAAEADVPLPLVLCYPLYRVSAYQRATNKMIEPAAAPFAYAVELMRAQPQPARAGTIFFPAHSTPHITVRMDYERLAAELAGLEEALRPVTVCIYWKDFVLGHHRPFVERGLRVVSAGHMFDPNFLYRFYHLCSQHRYSASNARGSHVFYSVLAGCRYFHADRVGYSVEASEEALRRDVSPLGPEQHRSLAPLLGAAGPALAAEQLEIARDYLGVQYLLSPAGIRRTLLRAEMLDKVGFRVRDGEGGARFAMPNCCQRPVQRWLQRLVRLRKHLIPNDSPGA
jgi:hypothetical protein